MTEVTYQQQHIIRLTLPLQRFGVVNEAEVGIFLELACFFSDPMDVVNLICFLCLF